MLSALALATVAATSLLPAAPPQDARAIVDAMLAERARRAQGVDNYSVYQHMEGLPALERFNEVPLHFQRHTVEGTPVFGMVTPNEYLVAKKIEDGSYVPSPVLQDAANKTEMVGEVMAQEMAQEGVPLIPGPNRFVPGTDPRPMFQNYAMFLRASADAQDAALREDFGETDARSRVQDLTTFGQAARLVGTETVDGHESYRLESDGGGRVVASEGGTFAVESVSMWIDTEKYVPRRTRIEGTMTADGESHPLAMEWFDQDYREVGTLYEPHRRVMRITGILDALSEEDRARLLEARAQMEQLEGQMDQVPEMARGMIEGQIENMRAQMASMEEGGAFELVTVVDRIEINEGPPPP